MTATRPNLLFIVTDHQRADSLGMVQCGREVTPHLNVLASQGASFTRAYTTCPLCVPARTALATGLYPTRNGVVFNDWRGQRAGHHQTLHECLHQAGYTLAHIGVHHIRVRPDLREVCPFAVWVDEGDYSRYARQRALAPLGGPSFRRTVLERQGDQYVEKLYSNRNTAVWQHDLADFKDCFFASQGIDFLKRSHRSPFALFVYLWAPHPPLVVPEPFASLFPAEDIVLPANVGVPASDEPSGRRRGIAAQLAAGVSKQEWRKVWAAHLGLVHMADGLIGQMLEVLEQAGNEANTMVVFTTDHGEHLGQHSMYQKMEMYEQAVRVPLLIRMPGASPTQISTPVSHLDVMPTLLDLAGLERPQGLDGVSLASTIQTGTLPPERPVFVQYSGNPTVGDIRRAVVSGQYKYVYDPYTSPELYDLCSDPLETANLAASAGHHAVLRRLHEQCQDWAKTHGDWVSFAQ